MDRPANKRDDKVSTRERKTNVTVTVTYPLHLDDLGQEVKWSILDINKDGSETVVLEMMVFIAVQLDMDFNRQDVGFASCFKEVNCRAPLLVPVAIVTGDKSRGVAGGGRCRSCNRKGYFGKGRLSLGFALSLSAGGRSCVFWDGAAGLVGRLGNSLGCRCYCGAVGYGEAV